MGLFFDIGNKIKSSGALISIILLFFYFGFYAFYGERGLRKYLYLSKEVEYARNLSDQYKETKEHLNTWVRLISPDSLDLDMLEERVKIVLNYAGDDEFIILDDKE
jgi:cell division protein FtsB